MSQRQEDNGVLTWVLIALTCFGIVGAMVWMAGAHYIVFYTAPLLKALGSIWNILPAPLAGTAPADLDVTYRLFRKFSNRIGFGDWLDYVNTVLKPYSYLFAGIAAALFWRQIKNIKAKFLNGRLTPSQLAEHMMNVFSDIAPVVAIQEKLVTNSLPKWSRQVFPEEFIKNARYQGKTVLLPDPKATRTDGDRGLMLDESRITGYLTETKPYKHDGMTLLASRHLGRQIVDIMQDGKRIKAGKKVVHPDRLSDVGKAMFAILAPYAFGAKKGREQSRKVVDALNYSAYGSPEGMANLSIDEVSESFNQWRDHALANKLAKVHHWEHTYLFALLEEARRSGKIGTWSFIWLKPMDRVLFYVLNTCGRKTPHSEAGLAFSQVQFERRVVRDGSIAISADGKPRIFTRQVVAALQEDWEAWRQGDEDTQNWWQDDGLADWESNTAFMDAMGEMNRAPDVPAGAY